MLLPYRLSTPTLPFSPALPVANVNSFKTFYILNYPRQDGRCAVFPISPTAGGPAHIPKDLVSFLATMWLHKPFLSEELPAVEVCVKHIPIGPHSDQ